MRINREKVSEEDIQAKRMQTDIKWARRKWARGGLQASVLMEEVLEHVLYCRLPNGKGNTPFRIPEMPGSVQGYLSYKKQPPSLGLP